MGQVPHGSATTPEIAETFVWSRVISWTQLERVAASRASEIQAPRGLRQDKLLNS